MLIKRQREMRWLTQVRKALTEKRFRLYRQTILALHKDAGDAADAAEELHYELLIRLLDEHGEVVLPKNFLGTVERYGLAAQLDYWVVQTALDWLLSHPQHLQQLTLCTINLSAYTLTDDAFLIFLLEQLQKNPQLPHKLCFEITETAVISNLPHATRFIDEVRQYGCRFALDDFGSGQASFVYLKTLPVDFLKIDGSLVRDIVGDPVDREMIKCIHGMARATGKRTIAEFAESTAILTILRDIGIDYAQGYAISRPQPLQQPVCAAPGVETLIC
jgi:EAL domain-containing protein (putative c-di-GMP-specific phosphodiesterase class I)